MYYILSFLIWWGGGEGQRGGEGEGETNTNQDYVLLAGGQTGKMHIHISKQQTHFQ
jgi:hypothetical protein